MSALHSPSSKYFSGALSGLWRPDFGVRRIASTKGSRSAPCASGTSRKASPFSGSGIVFVCAASRHSPSTKFRPFAGAAPDMAHGSTVAQAGSAPFWKVLLVGATARRASFWRLCDSMLSVGFCSVCCRRFGFTQGWILARVDCVWRSDLLGGGLGLRAGVASRLGELLPTRGGSALQRQRFERGGLYRTAQY